MLGGLDVRSFPVAGSKYSSSSVGLDVTIFPVEGSKYRFSVTSSIAKVLSLEGLDNELSVLLMFPIFVDEFKFLSEKTLCPPR